MFGFTAYFYKNRTLIEGAGQYKTNEILTAYLPLTGNPKGIQLVQKMHKLPIKE